MEIAGFTPRQMDLANRIWALDSPEQIIEFFDTLPRSLLVDAYTVYQMIIWEFTDQEDPGEMTEARAVIDHIRGLSC